MNPSSKPEIDIEVKPKKPTTAGRIFLRGLGIALPSVLTVVILIWLLSLVNNYIIRPTSSVVRFTIANLIDASVDKTKLKTLDNAPPLPYCEKNYRVSENSYIQYQTWYKQYQQTEGEAPPKRLAADKVDRNDAYVVFGNHAVPYNDYIEVAQRLPESQMPRSTTGLYMELGLTRYFLGVVPLSLLAVLILLALIFFLGRVVTARVGSWSVSLFERKVIGGLPVVRNVYSSVKQITDFLFSENQIEYRRVVAVEYPRKGIWSLGFVTGESMLQIVETAGEPCVTVLIPTSPMPMTGYTMSIPKSAVLDLDITVEQAFQFCVSCGVLVPPQQKPKTVIAETIEQAVIANDEHIKTNLSSSSDSQNETDK